jgi:alpha-1,2-mannosyltransferase
LARAGKPRRPRRVPIITILDHHGCSLHSNTVAPKQSQGLGLHGLPRPAWKRLSACGGDTPQHSACGGSFGGGRNRDVTAACVARRTLGPLLRKRADSAMRRPVAVGDKTAPSAVPGAATGAGAEAPRSPCVPPQRPPPKTGATGAAWWHGAPPSREAAACLLFACRGLGALYAPIADCDEVFNYWEPLHFSVYGTGAQTWEYSPQHALRSWTYILLHALNAVVFRHFYAEPLGGLLQQLGAPAPKIWVFYLMRLSLVAVSSVADASLYSAVAHELAPPGPNRPRALAVLVLLCVSCGLVSNSCAFLPSTFAMYLTSAASAALLRLPEKHAASNKVGRGPDEGDRTAAMDGSDTAPRCNALIEERKWHMQMCIGCMVVAVLVGWPFVGLLALPMAYLLVFRLAPAFSLWTLIKTTVLAVLAVALPMAAIESALYGRPAMPPLNIVLYNVLGRGGDSTLYGTEPWWFYLANLSINFNIALPLALLLPVLLLVKSVTCRSTAAGGKGDWHLLCWISPLYWWLAFLSSQAHKEERFMFAIYPLLATAAGVCLADAAHVVVHVLAPLILLERGSSRHAAVARALVFLVLVLSALLSASRFLTMALYFSAPMTIWPAVGRTLPLYRPAWGILESPLTVCVGKEWFRFPGNLLVDTSWPRGGSRAEAGSSHATTLSRATSVKSWRLGYIKSEFDGQLPSEFRPVPLDAQDLVGGLSARLRAMSNDDGEFNSANKEVLSRS